MEDADTNIRILLDSSARLVSSVSMKFRRYLQAKIDWNDRLICIKGPKGTGKTTLILQHIRETFGAQSERAVYLAADHIWFSSHDIMEAIDYFSSHGYTHLFIDEVHHLPAWSRVIKTVSDFYPQLNVVYSGSSILKLSKGSADLSRRQAVYNLKGLSFREFLGSRKGSDPNGRVRAVGFIGDGLLGTDPSERGSVPNFMQRKTRKMVHFVQIA